MHVEHVALWTQNLDRLKTFYETYFQASAGEKYANAEKQFESYFLAFSSGARLEIMQVPTITGAGNDPDRPLQGYAHVAFSVGSEQAVDALTERLREDGYRVVDGPRHTGDGYYESAILDPDGNRIEITV